MIVWVVHAPVFAKTIKKTDIKKSTKTEIKVIGPAADELYLIFSAKPSKNISCTEVIIPACPNCDGGTSAKVCTLNAEKILGDY